MSLAIEHRPEQGRFQAVVDGHTCLLDYRNADGVMTILHTEVPAELGGRGLAGHLMQAALAHARDAGLKVQPACSYAASYMKRHPETGDLHA